MSNYPPAFQQKLEERTASLSRAKFADAKDRERWENVLCPDMISCEDSGTDNGEEVLIVRTLPWRSSRMDHMFANLDKQSLSNKSPQSRRQMKRRVLGECSLQPRCTVELPKWVFSS